MKKIIFSAILVLSLLLSSCQKNSDPVFKCDFDGDVKSTSSISSLSVVPHGNITFPDGSINGKYLKLNDGYLTLEGSRNLDLKRKFSFETWMKFDDFVSYNPIIFGRPSSNGEIQSGPVSIYFNDNYTSLQCDLTFVMKDGSYKTHSFISRNTVSVETLDMWHHFCFVFDASSYTIYIDSSPVYTEKMPANLSDFSYIAQNGTDYFIGESIYHNMTASIDCTKIYSDCISHDLIEKNYNDTLKQFRHKLTLSPDSCDITVNGKKKKLTSPVVNESMTKLPLVPARSFCESIGAGFNWDGSDSLGRMDITYNDNKISLWMWNSNATVNSSHMKISPYPAEVNSIAYIPLKFVINNLGGFISYEKESSEYSIYF